MPTIYQFIIIAAGLFGAFQFTKITSIFFKMVLITQLVAIVLTLPLLGPTLYTLGFAIFYAASLAITLQALFAKGRAQANRIILTIITLPGFLAALFMLQHWPYVQHLILLQILSVLAYLIFVLLKKGKYKNEFASLTIIAADALIHVIMLII